MPWFTERFSPVGRPAEEGAQQCAQAPGADSAISHSTNPPEEASHANRYLDLNPPLTRQRAWTWLMAMPRATTAPITPLAAMTRLGE